MRRALCLGIIVIGTSVFAQEQERKLVDRLLKPDMTLANGAQNKDFVGVREATAKAVTARQFGGVHQTAIKEYSGQRAFFAWLFGRTREFPRNRAASLSTRSDVPRKTFTTRESPVREANDSQKSVTAKEYGGIRPFVARGKSQKNLDAQHDQMSIDEVRELLNRNK